MIDPIFREILTAIGGPVERDNETSELYDWADKEDRAYDDWRQKQLDEEREQTLNAALDACKEAGVPVDHLKTLVFETGATFWALKESLKG